MNFAVFSMLVVVLLAIIAVLTFIFGICINEKLNEVWSYKDYTDGIEKGYDRIAKKLFAQIKEEEEDEQ